MSESQQYRFFASLVKRPILLLTILVTSVVVGLISYDRIRVQMMPDGIVEPGLQIFVTNPGGSAQENEEQVARVLEAELRTLPRLEDISSHSGEDRVFVSVEFKADTDMDMAKAEVRDRVERARANLPTSVVDVGIWSWSESDLPVMFFALLHPGESERTDFLVDEVIQRRLESVDGVGRVEVWGLSDDSMRILLDEDRVKAASLDLGALIRRLAADNFALPLGEVDDGGSRILLRSDMRFRTPAEIEAFPIGDGLTIGDVGRVTTVKTVRNSLFRIDGSYAYFGEIQRDGQANVVETCHRLKAAFADLERDSALAGGFRFIPLFNQGEFIETSIKQLEDTAITGGWLAVVILFMFLWRVRLTLLIALSIPVSVLVAIAWVYFTGGSFNVLTMTGITLAMGMLVDNAIVVIENITRLRALGRSPREAVVEGTGEVALAVTLSTLTSVVVFLPLIFMSANPALRIMFGELGIPLCVSLLISLLVALVLMPVMAERSLGPRPAWLSQTGDLVAPIGAVPARCVAWTIGGLRVVFLALVRVLQALNRAALAVLTPLRWPLAAGLLAWAAWRVSAALPALAVESETLELRSSVETSMGSRLIPVIVQNVVPAVVAALILLIGLRRWRARPAAVEKASGAFVSRATSIVDMVVDANQRLMAWTLEHRLAASALCLLLLGTIAIPISNMTVAAFGEDDNRTRINVFVELEDNFTLAQAAVEMQRYEDFLQSKKSTYRFTRLGNRFDRTGGRLSMYWEQSEPRPHMDFVLRDVKEHAPRYPGHKLHFLDDEEGADSRLRSVVSFVLHGPDYEELERLGRQAVKILEEVPGLSSVRASMGEETPQVNVRLDSDLAQQLGVTPRAALENISWALRGVQLPRYQEPGREIPLIIEYDQEEVARLDSLRDLDVYSGTSSIPLSSFANLEFGRSSREIERRNGQVTFGIQARVDNPTRQRELSDAGLRALQTLDLPRGYSIGDEESVSFRQDEEMKEMLAALVLSVVLVFLLMGVLFESFILPFSVLFTLPYAVMGSYWTLYVTGTVMDSVGWIGIIILVGVVANHGIVLIDRIHGLRRLGVDRKTACLDGCAHRVRPVLMTSLTAVMGLVPMAITEPPGEGIDYRALATCVAGGLALSTLFTLWVVPLAYTVLDDLARVVGAEVRWSLRPARWFSGRRAPPSAAPAES